MILSFFDDKSILVLGGGGKLCRELINLLLKSQAHRIVVMNKEEKLLISLKSFFSKHADFPRLRFFLGEKSDLDRLMRAFDGVDVVINLDCFSDRELLDYNPMEAVKTNITAIENICHAAIERGVSFVLEVDKANFFDLVDLYDATKVCSEKFLISSNGLSAFRKTRFSVMRMGDLWDYPDNELSILLENKDKIGLQEYLSKNQQDFHLGSTVESVCRSVLACLASSTGGEIFIPKLQRYSISDYVSSIVPEFVAAPQTSPSCSQLKMSFTSESKGLWESDEFYIVCPIKNSWWDEELFLKKNKDVKKMKEGFLLGKDNFALRKFSK